jgi:hypothetical protein
VFAENSYWKVAQFLTAMGHTLTGDEDIDPVDYVGRQARALVGVHEFRGLSQNYIEKWLPPLAKPSGDGNAVSAAEIAPGSTITEDHSNAI